MIKWSSSLSTIRSLGSQYNAAPTHTRTTRERERALASGRIAYFEFPSASLLNKASKNDDIRFWLKKCIVSFCGFTSAPNCDDSLSEPVMEIILNFIFGVFAGYWWAHEQDEGHLKTAIKKEWFVSYQHVRFPIRSGVNMRSMRRFRSWSEWLFDKRSQVVHVTNIEYCFCHNLYPKKSIFSIRDDQSSCEYCHKLISLVPSCATIREAKKRGRERASVEWERELLMPK